MKYVLIVLSWCINRYLIHTSINFYIINRSHRLMKTSSIAVIAINIQSDSILRQTNKVHVLTEKILYRTTPELHQTMLKNFSYVQHPAPKFTKLHQTTPTYSKLQQTTLNNTELYKLRKTAIGLPSELQCTRLKLI